MNFFSNILKVKSYTKILKSYKKKFSKEFKIKSYHLDLIFKEIS